MAGKRSIFAKVRSLLHKEQAPSSSAPVRHFVQARPISTEESRNVAELLHSWVQARGYRLAHATVVEAAENIGTDSVLLQRYCVNCLGQDFRAWRTSLRLEDAKKLMLEEPGLSTSRIAAIVGVNDRSNFLRLFVKHTGQTPDQWRKNHGVKSTED